MCLAVPGKIVAIDAATEPRMGRVDFGGVRKEVCLAWVPGAKVGDYVVVHVGFAIETLDEEEASATLDILSQMTPPREEG